MLSVACALGWISEAFRPIANLARKSYSEISRATSATDLVYRISGIITTCLMASPSTQNYGEDNSAWVNIHSFLKNIYPTSGEEIEARFIEEIEKKENDRLLKPSKKSKKASSLLQTPPTVTNSITIAGYMDFDPKMAATKNHRTHGKKGHTRNSLNSQNSWFKL